MSAQMIYAIKNKNMDIIDNLIYKKQNIDMVDNNNNSALIHAIQHKWIECGIKLIQCGSNPNIINNKNQSALSLSINYDLYDIVILLNKYKVYIRETEINLLVANDKYYDIIKNAICIYNFDISMLLITALTNRQIKNAKLLLDEKICNVNVRDQSTLQTPLMIAIKIKSLEMVNELIKKKCNLNIQDMNGWTALMYATCTKQVNIVELLLKHNCNIKLVSNLGTSALSIGCEMQNIEIVRMLCFAYIEQKDNSFEKFTITEVDKMINIKIIENFLNNHNIKFFSYNDEIKNIIKQNDNIFAKSFNSDLADLNIIEIIISYIIGQIK
ncbi:MAG: hypothetical protein Edafosvirus2_47 [Edafosvirus sp.]|uniref:Uncharacterized protein n=1 Tax=Edafosvirus sp. TaxID=2487765 RepID=A0A3G4ZSK0_9VIRU|nr:MAG: hypothetical protein Edafosvirus2_47 [Edafosvirus sp.]